MNVLITGVAGLLGSRLADWIIKNTEHNVVGIDDLSGGYEENIPDEIPYLKFNLIDNESVEKVYKDIDFEMNEKLLCNFTRVFDIIM